MMTRLLKLREPVPLPQRLRLLGAAKRVERVGGDAGAVLRSEAWLYSGSGLMGRERGLAEGEGLAVRSVLPGADARNDFGNAACPDDPWPSDFSPIAMRLCEKGSASLARPTLRSRTARLLRRVATSGCSEPRTISPMTIALRKSGSASAS